MPVAVADTGPLNYLILIGQAEVLPELIGRILIPSAVHKELSSPGAPDPVRRWFLNAPDWITIRNNPAGPSDEVLRGLDPGEREAIKLSIQTGADLLLMDDRRGVRAARQLSLRVTGTLGILDLAAEKGLIHFVETVARLSKTNFRLPKRVLAEIIAKRGLRETR